MGVFKIGKMLTMKNGTRFFRHIKQPEILKFTVLSENLDYVHRKEFYCERLYHLQLSFEGSFMPS